VTTDSVNNVTEPPGLTAETEWLQRTIASMARACAANIIEKGANWLPVMTLRGENAKANIA
jgi:hypothetical protein